MSSEMRLWCCTCGNELTALHVCPTLQACAECSQPFRVSDYLPLPVVARMGERGCCYFCIRMLEAVEHANSPKSVRISGRLYWIGPEDLPEREPRGFLGARARIAFHDGRHVESTNLWAQGQIPEHFKSRLPDNAAWEEQPW
jgi:hypothetical protein